MNHTTKSLMGTKNERINGQQLQINKLTTKLEILDAELQTLKYSPHGVLGAHNRLDGHINEFEAIDAQLLELRNIIYDVRSTNDSISTETLTPAEPQYVMAEPMNVGAVVVDSERFEWIRSTVGYWVNIGNKSMARNWVDLDNPQPSQNIELTADDPEPPHGSAVIDCDGEAWQNSSNGWVIANNQVSGSIKWSVLHKVASPVLLVWRGKETK